MVNDKPFIQDETYKTFSDPMDEEKFKKMLCDEKGKPALFQIGENKDGSLFASKEFSSSQGFIDPKLPEDTLEGLYPASRKYQEKVHFMNDCLEKCIQHEIERLLLPTRKEVEKIIRMKYHKLKRET
jgi:hypothetical protein